MATIIISDLCPTGSELFADSESYLNDLTDDELSLTQGGSSPVCAAAVWSSWGCVKVSIRVTLVAYAAYQGYQAGKR
jgi:hypothetical protein